MDEVSTIKAFECVKCHKSFTERKYLIQHQRRKIPCDRKLRCEKCGKTFISKRDLDRHLEDRKTPCEPIVGGKAPTVGAGENKCVFCGRNFTTTKRLENHVAKCKIANNKKVFADGTFKAGMEVLAEKVKKEDDEYVSIKKSEFDDIKRELAELKQQKNTTQIVNNITYNDNRIQTIIINGFDGEQHRKHLNLPEVLRALNLPQPEIVPKITELLHGSPKAPQNHNIYLPNITSADVLLLERDDGGQRWTKKELMEIYPKLLDRCVNLLYEADDKLTENGSVALTDIEGDKFEMLLNKQRSKTITDEDLEELRPILYKMKTLIEKKT